MIRLSFPRLISALGVALLTLMAGVPGTVAAQDGSLQWEGFADAAWAEMQEGLEEFLSADGAARLTYIAYHDVVVNLCDDLTLDEARFKNAVLHLHPLNWGELSDEEHRAWNDRFLVQYGMAFGVLLAEHADNRDAVCAEARGLAADEEEYGFHLFNAI